MKQWVKSLPMDQTRMVRSPLTITSATVYSEPFSRLVRNR